MSSGYRPHHKTETALVKVLNDIDFNTNSGKISVLVLLDRSAAFDTIDLNILLDRLETGLDSPLQHYISLKVPYHKKHIFSGLYIYKLVLPEPANSLNEENQ